MSTETYQDWIQAHVVGDGYGKCAETTLAMTAVFPELQRVRGHYWCAFWGRRDHWWLKTASGEIVDPTAAQFPSRGHGEYEEWIEGTEEPTGKCPNCGGYCYQGRSVCSDSCHREYAAYLNASTR